MGSGDGTNVMSEGETAACEGEEDQDEDRKDVSAGEPVWSIASRIRITFSRSASDTEAR